MPLTLLVHGISRYPLHDRCRIGQISFSTYCRKFEFLSGDGFEATVRSPGSWEAQQMKLGGVILVAVIVTT